RGEHRRAPEGAARRGARQRAEGGQARLPARRSRSGPAPLPGAPGRGRGALAGLASPRAGAAPRRERRGAHPRGPRADPALAANEAARSPTAPGVRRRSSAGGHLAALRGPRGAPGSAARATSPARLLSWQVLPQRRRRHAGAARGGLRRRAPAVRRARVGVERARPGGGGDVVKGGSAMVLLPIRLVTGWMFFSAFHRRVVLDAAKLTPDAPGYVGEKFNQFMPGAILGVGDLIGALLDRPGALHAFLWTFTIVEALAGLALLLGLGTRLAALGTLLLSAGILAGA